MARSCLILLHLVGVDLAINLYRKLVSWAVEVEDESPDRMLATKPQAIEAPPLQGPPRQSLGGGQPLAQLPGGNFTWR